MTKAALLEHLATGRTTVCRAWTVTRRDGQLLGFTDHDGDLVVEGVVHRASSGLTARSVQSATGLAVDNSEVLGALSDASISDADLTAGRYDGAEVRLRLVNWAKPDEAAEIFRGSIGEVVRSGAEFRAELRGISEALNQPVGLVYARGCAAVLGDKRCRFDLTQPGYFAEAAIAATAQSGAVLTFSLFQGFDERWFEGGRLEVLTGAAAGLVGMVKSDRQIGADREVVLWQSIRAPLAAGDQVRILAGCDKRPDTCRRKFSNMLNFRGFPFIPGDDWLSAYPRPGQSYSGGSLTSG